MRSCHSLSVAPVSNPFFQPQEKTVEPTTAKVSFYEKHKIIYAKRVRGYFDNWRILLVAFTQVLFYGGLWLTWNDRQAILLHLVERKFYIFGVVFWPQDVIYGLHPDIHVDRERSRR